MTTTVSVPTSTTTVTVTENAATVAVTSASVAVTAGGAGPQGATGSNASPSILYSMLYV